MAHPGTGKYERLLERCRGLQPIATAVAWPCDETSLAGAIEAAKQGLITPILVGSSAKIAEVAEAHGIDVRGVEVIDVADSRAAAAGAVRTVREGRAELLMKGSLHTDELMRSVTAKSTGLRTDRRISHVFAIDVPGYAQTLFITDAAINIFPDLDCKRDIVQNAIDLYAGIGLGTPRVGILSAVETVTLSDYRTRYAQYRRDADLQELHRQHPMIAIWDDHDIASNANVAGSQNHTEGAEGTWTARVAAALQAHYEWMPVRVVDAADPRKDYRSFSYGNLVDLMMLEERVFARSPGHNETP